jgi:hypothetical protein
MPIGTHKGDIHNTDTHTPTHHIDQLAYEEHQRLGLIYPIKSHDQELSRFFTELEGEYSTKITSMIRVLGYNDKGKQTEYLTWTETLQAVDKEGNTIRVSDIPRGVTQELVGIEYYNGQPVAKSYRSKTKYTVEFSKEKVEELIDKSEFPESIQFLFKGSKTWGNFSRDEFINITHSEGEMRGRTGSAGLYPSNVQVKPAQTQQYQVIQQGQGTNKK